MTIQFLPFGEDAVLVELDTSPVGCLSQIKEAFPEATVRPGLSTVLISFPSSSDPLQEVSTRFPELTKADSFTSSNTHVIPITYDGPDLNLAAECAGLSVSQLIQLHQKTLWQVALIGFAPGFPYLIPEANSEIFQKISRLASPRTKVPEKSVGLAAGMSCIYPSASPGGWLLIGTVAAEIFDVNQMLPNLFNVGEIVQFEAAK